VVKDIIKDDCFQTHSTWHTQSHKTLTIYYHILEQCRKAIRLIHGSAIFDF